MFTNIRSAQLLAVTKWSRADLDNRSHANQMTLAFGLTLPTENGVYIGPDCFALRLADKLVDAGFSRAQAGRFVRENHEKWVRGLEQIEWPRLFPPVEPVRLMPTKRALDMGITEFPPDIGIYFAIAKTLNGDFHTACGTHGDIINEAVVPLMREGGAGAPALVTQVNLGWVYEDTLKAAEQAGVDLGAPFTRPLELGEAEHREWFAAVEVHRALSFARQKVRKPPGPPPAKGKVKTMRPERSRAVRQTAAKVIA